MANFKYLKNLNNLKEIDDKKNENIKENYKDYIFYINYNENELHKYNLKN